MVTTKTTKKKPTTKKTTKKKKTAAPIVQVGQDILSYCTHCKMDLNHTAVSLKKERVSKVECRTCKKMHQYRKPKGITEPPKQESRTSEGTLVSEEWKIRKQNNPLDSIAYKTTGTFQVGDFLKHKIFGEGFVEKILYPNKIQVLFENDYKVLIHDAKKQ